MANKQTRKR